LAGARQTTRAALFRGANQTFRPAEEMGATAGAGFFAGGDGLIRGGFMEGLCPSKPPRQRPGGLWKPVFWGAPTGSQKSVSQY
jgi:hypothetical protein